MIILSHNTGKIITWSYNSIVIVSPVVGPQGMEY